jgi:dynactin-5
MEAQMMPFDEAAYFLTSKKNRISKQSLIKGTDNILIDGKAIILPGAILRGDLADIIMGEYVIIKEDVIIRPTYAKGEGQKRLKYVKQKFGSYIVIDRGSIVCSLRIGNNVHIGKNCIIGHRSIIKDNAKILDNSIVPPDTIIPPFTVFGGKPANYVGELPESFDKFQTDLAVTFYKNFRPMNMSQQMPAPGGSTSARPGAPPETPGAGYSAGQNTKRVLAEQEKKE